MYYGEGLLVADDTPGISARERCIKRMELMKWLEYGVDFGHFPSYGARIKGLSNILYEGLRLSLEAKLYLYALSKKGTYSARAPNTLCSESFFSSMQDMDPWGQGVLTGEGIQKHLNDFTTITAMKMEPSEKRFVLCLLSVTIVCLSVSYIFLYLYHFFFLLPFFPEPLFLSFWLYLYRPPPPLCLSVSQSVCSVCLSL